MKQKRFIAIALSIIILITAASNLSTTSKAFLKSYENNSALSSEHGVLSAKENNPKIGKMHSQCILLTFQTGETTQEQASPLRKLQEV